jgi:hypothetical protein
LFSYDSIIKKVVSTGYNVVFRLNNGNLKYQYQRKDYTPKEIWKQFAKKQQRWIAGYPIKGCCVILSLPETGEVKLLITSDLFLNRVEYKYVIKLNDIIEDALFSIKEPLTAKV